MMSIKYYRKGALISQSVVPFLIRSVEPVIIHLKQYHQYNKILIYIVLSCNDSLYLEGLDPYFCLKHLLKYRESLIPTIYAICDML